MDELLAFAEFARLFFFLVAVDLRVFCSGNSNGVKSRCNCSMPGDSKSPRRAATR